MIHLKCLQYSHTVVQDETEIPYIIRSRLPLVAEYWNKCQWLFNIISLIRVSINLIKTEIFSSGSITNHMNRQHKTLKHTLTPTHNIQQQSPAAYLCCNFHRSHLRVNLLNICALNLYASFLISVRKRGDGRKTNEPRAPVN